jgi:poly(A) polymerase
MGGAVRNWMLGEHARDIDMVLTCSIEAALQMLMPLSGLIKLKPKIDFGLLYLIGDNGDIDVNSLRDCTDINGNTDIDSVIFSCGRSLEIDAQIRDFTINSFYMRVSDRLIINHFPQALEDLESRTIRLIMDARKLAIDYRTTIRILQFMARGYEPTDYTLSVLRARLDADILQYDKYGEWLAFHVPPSSPDREAFRKLAFYFSQDRAAARRLETWFEDEM